MPNLFKPSANTAAKLSLIAGGALPAVVLLAGSMVSRSQSNTGVENPLDQPVPFSHKHHAIELGIDCRYCHTDVERSNYAGIPSSETCMSCHSVIWTNAPALDPIRKSYETNKPIQWTLVNKTPEFVYFDHSIHVNRGINCNQCHGPIQRMHITMKGKTFFMSWCLECHKSPQNYLYTDEKNPEMSPRQQVFNLYKKAQRDPNGHQMNEFEKGLIVGPHTEQRVETPELVAKGNDLLKKRGVKSAQLTDCGVCHR